MSSALHQAAQIGQLQTIKQLLAEGADVNAADAHGRYPLHVAAEMCHTDVAQLLLTAGGSVDGSSRGWTPLFTAASLGPTEMVQLLLCKGANPQLRDGSGVTAVSWAALHGHTVAVQLLLEAWGQPQIPAAVLIHAARNASLIGYWAAFARLAKELRQLYPAQLHQLFEGHFPIVAADAVAAMLDAWASDVSSLDEQQAALRMREEAVVSEQQAVQRLIVGVAGMAMDAQQDID